MLILIQAEVDRSSLLTAMISFLYNLRIMRAEEKIWRWIIEKRFISLISDSARRFAKVLLTTSWKFMRQYNSLHGTRLTCFFLQKSFERRGSEKYLTRFEFPCRSFPIIKSVISLLPLIYLFFCITAQEYIQRKFLKVTSFIVVATARSIRT